MSDLRMTPMEDATDANGAWPNTKVNEHDSGAKMVLAKNEHRDNNKSEGAQQNNSNDNDQSNKDNADKSNLHQQRDQSPVKAKFKEKRPVPLKLHHQVIPLDLSRKT